MGVKSTVRLTRQDAIESFIQLKIESKKAKWREKAAAMSDIELETVLEELNDKRHEREYGEYGGFHNYLIVHEEDIED